MSRNPPSPLLKAATLLLSLSILAVLVGRASSGCTKEDAIKGTNEPSASGSPTGMASATTGAATGATTSAANAVASSPSAAQPSAAPPPAFMPATKSGAPWPQQVTPQTNAPNAAPKP